MIIVHLLPLDAIGGAEIAAKSFKTYSSTNIFYKVFFFRDNSLSLAGTILRFIEFLDYINRSKVDLLIVSLWPSCLLALCVKIFMPRLPMILLIHSTVSVHFFDYIFTKLFSFVCLEVWSDCLLSLRSRLPYYPERSTRVVSFLTTRLSPLPTRSLSPSFIFWGRLHQCKGIDRAFNLVYLLKKLYPNVSFLVIGPDAGSLCSLIGLRNRLNLDNNISFLGPMDFEHIQYFASSCSFFLQLSHFEGYGMSVVESMQLGLLPVVTPVGNISSYCCHQINSLLLDNEHKLVENIVNLIDNPHLYFNMRQASIDTWKNQATYSESVTTELLRLLGFASSVV